jgi:hypothetical protein
LVILWSENKWNLPKSNEVNDAPSQLALGTEAPGDINMWMSTKMEKIDFDDRTDGDPIPEATMGLNLQLNYKTFDFSIYFCFSRK